MQKFRGEHLVAGVVLGDAPVKPRASPLVNQSGRFDTPSDHKY